MPARKKLLCVGLGYPARVLAAELAAEGWRIAGTCRDEGARAALAAQGFEVHLLDRDRPLPDAAAILAGSTHLLSSVPPDPAGDPVLALHGADIAAVGGLEWAGYLSTTGVYGDRGGGWVDADAPLRPTGPRGRRRVAAEAGWLDLWWDHGLPVHLFRLAGIYGPGRNALATARAGDARIIDKPGQVFSRIHVADIVQVLRASMARPRPGAVYNVCDDDPAPPGAVIAHACALLGVAPPDPVPFAEADLSPLARGFYADNKRVRNARIKNELGVALRFPDYHAGLAALCQGEDFLDRAD
ncbi:MAG: SDR family oxidoreductase [Alphaproteobacteria bacterium]